jgi:hypothetical protein
MQSSREWKKDFVERVRNHPSYFDDMKEKERLKPIKDTRATRLRAQRAKQMAGRFRLKNKAAAMGKSDGSMSARSEVSNASTKAMVGRASPLKKRPSGLPSTIEDSKPASGTQKGRARKK